MKDTFSSLMKDIEQTSNECYRIGKAEKITDNDDVLKFASQLTALRLVLEQRVNTK